MPMTRLFAILILMSIVLCEEIDDAKAPLTFYPLEPGKPGKLLFLIGPPGSGKSTTALELAQNYGYKYYEGDCFIGHMANPYVPLYGSTSLKSRLSCKKQPKMKVGSICF